MTTTASLALFKIRALRNYALETNPKLMKAKYLPQLQLAEKRILSNLTLDDTTEVITALALDNVVPASSTTKAGR